MRTNPSVLIVGATGNLGSQLCTAFKTNGWRVGGTSRSTASRLALADRGIQSYYADVTDPQSLRELAHQATYYDTLVMNSGILKARSRAEYLRVNALGPLRTYMALSKAGKLPKNVVHISSQLVGTDLQDPIQRFDIGGLFALYNDFDRTEASQFAKELIKSDKLEIDELLVISGLIAADPNHVREIMSHYARSKAIGELLAYKQFVYDKGTDQGFISLRPAGILGRDDDVTTKPMVSGLKGIKVAGIYPNITRDPYPQIAVIRDKDLAAITEHVARANLILKQFGVYDVENGEEGLYLQEIVEAGKAAFGTWGVWSPQLPLLFRLVAGAQALARLGGYGMATVLDHSRVPELQNPNLATTNDRLYEAFPRLKDEVPLQTLKEIFQDIT